jgi:zinc/manganese transport system permease protein
MIVIAVAVAVVSGVVGLLVSYHAGAAAGPAIILVAGVLYAVSLVLGPVGGLRRHFVPGRHLEA